MTERTTRLSTKLLGIALVLGIAWIAIEISDPSTLPVRAVRFDGDLIRVDRAQLQQSLVPMASTGLLLVDVTALRDTVESAPWVDRAYVRRIWPDTLQVTVIEQEPLARWDETRLVNARGELFEPTDAELPVAMPSLHGPEGQAKVLVDQYRMLNPLLQRVGQHIASLELDARRAWTLELGSGMQVELGRHEVRARLQRLIGLLNRWPENDLLRIERVDLRYTNGFAIRWRAPEGGTAPARAALRTSRPAQNT